MNRMLRTALRTLSFASLLALSLIAGYVSTGLGELAGGSGGGVSGLTTNNCATVNAVLQMDSALANTAKCSTMVDDGTTVTFSTTLSINGSQISPAIRPTTGAGTQYIGATGGGATVFAYNNTALFTLNYTIGNGVFGSGNQLTWSATSAATGTPDSGLKRFGAGIIASTDGSTGFGGFQGKSLKADSTNNLIIGGLNTDVVQITAAVVSPVPTTVTVNNFAYGWKVTSPAQITANQDNYTGCTPGTAQYPYGHCRVSTDAARNITGLDSANVGSAALSLIITNVGSFNVVLVNDLTSTAANRFKSPTGANYTLTPNQSAVLMYDGTTARWRILAGSGT